MIKEHTIMSKNRDSIQNCFENIKYLLAKTSLDFAKVYEKMGYTFVNKGEEFIPNSGDIYNIMIIHLKKLQVDIYNTHDDITKTDVFTTHHDKIIFKVFYDEDEFWRLTIDLNVVSVGVFS
jgi:hypothetical protein